MTLDCVPHQVRHFAARPPTIGPAEEPVDSTTAEAVVQLLGCFELCVDVARGDGDENGDGASELDLAAATPLLLARTLDGDGDIDHDVDDRVDSTRPTRPTNPKNPRRCQLPPSLAAALLPSCAQAIDRLLLDSPFTCHHLLTTARTKVASDEGAHGGAASPAAGHGGATFLELLHRASLHPAEPVVELAARLTACCGRILRREADQCDAADGNQTLGFGFKDGFR